MIRHALNGPTMGTRWSAILFADHGADLSRLQGELQKAVDRVDDQMSPWKPQSELCRFNRLNDGEALGLPPEMLAVLRDALDINEVSGGAFDPFMGKAVDAWGFGPSDREPDQAGADALARDWHRGPRELHFDPYNGRLIRKGDAALDLCGIAKGYGADRLSETLSAHGFSNHLVAIDGELRAEGPGPVGNGWQIGIEHPDLSGRIARFVLEASGLGVATSGNYRHTRETASGTVSHTMDPGTGTPVRNQILSATVLADTCAIADGLATALMVMGRDRALEFAHELSLSVLLACEEGGEVKYAATGLLESLIPAA